MWQPAHVDGRTLVVVRPRASFVGGYEAVESGVLEHGGGGVLHLVRECGARVVTDAELAALQPVVPHTRIGACRGFDYFLLRPADVG